MKGNLRELKGVGEKTEKLFEKIGVFSMKICFIIIPEIMKHMRNRQRSEVLQKA